MAVENTCSKTISFSLQNFATAGYVTHNQMIPPPLEGPTVSIVSEAFFFFFSSFSLNERVGFGSKLDATHETVIDKRLIDKSGGAVAGLNEERRCTLGAMGII